MTTINCLELFKLSSEFEISFNCPKVDSLIGKIRSKSITEISGEAGTGKSTICYILCMMCALCKEYGGQDSDIIFLTSSENPFSIQRLQQLIESLNIDSINEDLILNRILIRKLFNYDDLIEILWKDIPIITQSRSIKLIIVDSIAGIFRHETDFLDDSFNIDNKRSELLFKISNRLKWISNTFNTAVVVCNEISSIQGETAMKEQRHVSSLGLTWTHCINTRIFLIKQSSLLDSKRIIFLDISPYHKSSYCYFQISDKGISGE